MEFKILKKSSRSRARLGILKTAHGEIETPTLVPVATRAVVKTLTSEEVARTKTQVLISNTFHLHLRPGEEIVKRAGGLHKFMRWPRPLMTDSGGFQVFSLGFGHDLGVGKIGKLKGASGERVREGDQPKKVTITDRGVHFRSPIDGRELFLGPKESMKIQQALGADIIFAFDECTPPLANYEYTKKSLLRTHAWARQCLQYHKASGQDIEPFPQSFPLLRGEKGGDKKSKQARSNFASQNLGRQALFGIVQGGHFKKLRIESAKFVSALPFDGFGIGGEFGSEKNTMTKMLDWIMPELPENKPRHLLGIGHLEDIPKIMASGIDTFDCTVPTQYGRHGVAFTSGGRLSLKQTKFLRDQKPLDPKCGCEVCDIYSRSYIAHLIRASEMTGLKFLTTHNLYFFNSFVEGLREKIKVGKL